MTVGTTFKAKVPLIAEAGISLDVTASYEFSYGLFNVYLFYFHSTAPFNFILLAGNGNN